MVNGSSGLCSKWACPAGSWCVLGLSRNRLVSQAIRGILYFILYISHFTDRRHFPLFFFHWIVEELSIAPETDFSCRCNIAHKSDMMNKWDYPSSHTEYYILKVSLEQCRIHDPSTSTQSPSSNHHPTVQSLPSLSLLMSITFSSSPPSSITVQRCSEAAAVAPTSRDTLCCSNFIEDEGNKASVPGEGSVGCLKTRRANGDGALRESRDGQEYTHWSSSSLAQPQAFSSLMSRPFHKLCTVRHIDPNFLFHSDAQIYVTWRDWYKRALYLAFQKVR